MNKRMMNVFKVALWAVVIALVMACRADVTDLKIENWGPQSAVLGDIPNIQPGGAMGLWIVTSEKVKTKNVQVTFDGQAVPTVVSAKVLTAAVSPNMIASPGEKEVAVKDLSSGKVLPVGSFVVYRGITENLKIEDWGPRTSVSGDIPNKLPDGAMGLWVVTSGMTSLNNVRITFGGQVVPTTVSEKVLTAPVPPRMIASAGKKEVALQELSTGKTLPVGVFEIKAAK